MSSRLPNHEAPHRFAISEEQLEAVLMLDGPDEVGTWPTLRFDTTPGSGATPDTAVPETTPHVHPVSLKRSQAEELMAGRAVEAYTVPVADEGGVVHGHVLLISRCP
jgi:hypothetical protein